MTQKRLNHVCVISSYPELVENIDMKKLWWDFTKTLSSCKPLGLGQWAPWVGYFFQPVPLLESCGVIVSQILQNNLASRRRIVTSVYCSWRFRHPY
ncbi:hypothetical protein PR048_017618 [Dryococelus australis]|uniref:Uncharacterized protein n=1 Tax=Dryococelus australis TaxID=614101 RepID=A0ABQ9HA05_9NEOP|nr:hypothetical protein PR048_017618 [Dryococelus australis]